MFANGKYYNHHISAYHPRILKNKIFSANFSHIMVDDDGNKRSLKINPSFDIDSAL
jgi:hypothetical protein